MLDKGSEKPSVTGIQINTLSSLAVWNSLCVMSLIVYKDISVWYSHKSESLPTLYVGIAPIYAILKQKPYNFPTNTLKAYLSA